MADKERFTLKRKAGRWNDQDFSAGSWRMISTAPHAIFLRKVIPQSTEKRTVYSQAVSQGKKKSDLTPLPLEKLNRCEPSMRNGCSARTGPRRTEEGGSVLNTRREDDYSGHPLSRERNSHLGVPQPVNGRTLSSIQAVTTRQLEPGRNGHRSLYECAAEGSGDETINQDGARRSIVQRGNAFKQIDSVMTLEPLGKSRLASFQQK
jgi:hypothetical protein